MCPYHRWVGFASRLECGFFAAEAEAALRSGSTPVRLGARILRTETAALAAMQTLWGDF